MKRHSLIAILVLMVIAVGCEKKNRDSSLPTNPGQTAQAGALSLRFDKTAVPAIVVSVEARLSREGFSTAIGRLNFQTDTSADISFNEVAAGAWTLRVDALDSAGVVRYSGSVGVNVVEGQVTDVFLTLSQTSTGTGQIHVFVTWGTEPSSWADYSGNPVLTGADSGVALRWIYNPKVIYDDEQYKMWFTAIVKGEGQRSVSYATSTRGQHWTIHPSSPVLRCDSITPWAYNHIGSGPVLKVGSTFRMYFSNISDFSNPWEIGLSTSMDGIQWTKMPDPVAMPPSGSSRISFSDVVATAGGYLAYYMKPGSTGNVVGVASSVDGVTWSMGTPPVLTPTQAWEGGGVYAGSVTLENETFIMVYMNDAGTGFGMAYSNDGLSWAKDGGNPFFTVDEAAGHWADQIAYPYVRHVGGELRVFYSGYNADRNDWSIGYVTKQ